MTRLEQLKAALIAWRKAEREHAVAVLSATTPNQRERLADADARALSEVRKIVDSQPWADIAQGL